MATKKKASAAAKEAPKKAAMSAEEKKAKRLARLEAIKNRPAGQRTNSKQIDVIELPNDQKVMTFGYAVRKTGTLVTAVVLDAKGNVVGISTELILGVKVKSKKGHGMVVPGVAGEGKKGRGAKADDAEEAEDEDDDDEDED